MVIGKTDKMPLEHMESSTKGVTLSGVLENEQELTREGQCRVRRSHCLCRVCRKHEGSDFLILAAF